jgi:hypothetical protein
VRDSVRRTLSETKEPNLVRLGENHLDALLQELSKRLGILHARPARDAS